MKNKKNVMSKQMRAEERCFYLFILPFIIGFSLFTIFPIVMSFLFSLNKMSVLDFAQNHWNFQGISNYINVLTVNNMFFLAMRNTFIFAFLRVFITLVLALLFALLLNQDIFAKKFLRTLIYVPAVLPIVGAAVLWRQIFDGQNSILSYVLSLIGIRIDSALWLGPYGLYSSVIMSVFMNIGPTMIILLAGLQGVPKEVEEAAMMDGAGAIRRFFSITIPFLSAVLFFTSITGFIGSLQVYAEVDLLINKLDASSMTLSLLAMSYYKNPTIGLGYSSAISWLIFLIVMVFTVIYFRLTKGRVYYAG